ncbi:MAG TPA: NAD(P)/FAD-dependent oxidoreductase [Roseiflexaceae bacterium]|nr:NAD(P)/FAD-dependent oxidoreductase [Roseiflexaceae bacterium]
MIDTKEQRTHEEHVQTPSQYTLAPGEIRHTGRPRVAIVGAGFGGLHAARALAGDDVDVLVLDRNNYHGFWPLLYQVATAGLESESIAYPVRAILRKYKNVAFEMVEVRGVDFERRQVLTDGEPIGYDYLVLAAGSANNYFGNDALAKETYGLKDLNDAERLRNRVLSAFERAVREPDAERRKALLTFVIVGGGPTGVELAGAFAELIRHVLRKDYPMLDIAQARVLLVEASDRVLASFPSSLQRSALKRLQKMGVEVRLQTAVDTVAGEHVQFKNGTTIEAGAVVWAAGVRAADLADALGVKQARGARVAVETTLQVPERPEVFVVGDMAYLEGYQGGGAYPMVAQVAMQMGKRAGRNILAQLHGQPMRDFRYFDKGQMATIGRRAAVLDAFGVRLGGLLAWLGWLFIHLMYLVGFRNRVIVLANWAYNYFTYDRGVRLITSED